MGCEIENGGWVRIWKKATMASLKEPTQNFPQENEENHEIAYDLTFSVSKNPSIRLRLRMLQINGRNACFVFGRSLVQFLDLRQATLTFSVFFLGTSKYLSTLEQATSASFNILSNSS
jgi:hypothetical protein